MIKSLIKFELPFLFLPFHFFGLLWFPDSSVIIKSDPSGNQHNYNGTKKKTDTKVDCTHAVNDGSRKHHQRETEKESWREKCWNIHGILPHTRGQFARSYFFLPCMFAKALHYVFISFTFIINYNGLHMTFPHTGNNKTNTSPLPRALYRRWKNQSHRTVGVFRHPLSDCSFFVWWC